jgi:protein-disulfide isomerase
MRPIAAFLMCVALVATLAGCKPADGASGAVTDADMRLGNPNAPVTVIEFASLGCPICAKWNNDNFDAFKAKYIDTGKVYYIFREFLTGDQPVAASGFLLARCAGKDKYFQVLDAVYHQEQPLLETDQNAAKRDALVRVAETAGLTEDQFQTCVSNNDALLALNDRAQKAGQKYNVDSTPTFVINGKTASGYQDMATMDKLIATAGPKPADP